MVGMMQAETRRSELLFKFLHAGCALLIDNLLQDGDYWRIEKSTNSENPLGNSFESLLHLISNFSQAEFDVFLFQTGSTISAATMWTPRPVSIGQIRCRL